MSNIQRHRLERNGAYLAEDHDGGWVLHSDHAAELARVEGERDANRRLLNKALKENTLLRAECEAWRKLWAAMKKDSRGSHTQELLKKLAAEAATDAAGILKGAGTQ